MRTLKYNRGYLRYTIHYINVSKRNFNCLGGRIIIIIFFCVYGGKLLRKIEICILSTQKNHMNILRNRVKVPLHSAGTTRSTQLNCNCESCLRLQIKQLKVLKSFSYMQHNKFYKLKFV